MTIQEVLSPLRRAIDDYKMIKSGDNIAVGLSGGKDSLTLLTALSALRRFYPEKFEVTAITVDTGLDFDKGEMAALKEYCEKLNVKYHIEKTEIGKVVFEYRKEENPCSLCANMRRGALNGAAVSLGCNKVALGHHADDLVETFMLSLMYEGRLSTFAPVTHLERANIDVIRPMIYLKERDIVGFAKDLPVLHNPCPVNHKTKREYVKDLLKSIRKDVPCLPTNLFNAITHPERINLPVKPTDNKDK